MNPTFTAIDFETAQGKRWSICQIGLVRVENGIVTEKINQLVCPPDNFYLDANTWIHGISADDTWNKPTFEEVWDDMRRYIHNQTVVAHNMAFDKSCLEQTLDYYQLPRPEFTAACTYKIYKKKLSVLCNEYRIPLFHHDALSDAMACASLFLQHLKGSI